MSQPPPRVLVVGATGAQGGGMARHLLRSGRWRVRAMTRDPGSPAARELAALGAEPVRGDLGDPAGMRPAFRGVDALYLVTDYWSLGADGEYRGGRNAVDLAVDAGVGHIVFSSGPETRVRSGGALPVPHYESKARLEAELRAGSAPATFLHLATYYENWPVRRLRPDPGGGLSFALPYGDGPIPAVSVTDAGAVALAVLDGGARFHGRTLGVVGDSRPGAHYAEVLTEVLGVPVRYRAVSHEVFASAPFENARALANMFEFSRRYLGGRQDDLRRSRELCPGLRTFEQWARDERSAFAPLLAS